MSIEKRVDTNNEMTSIVMEAFFLFLSLSLGSLIDIILPKFKFNIIDKLNII